jgi:hypothetical protein
MPLAAHPEAFELAEGADRIFVNVPDAGGIAVIDRRAGKQVASSALQGAHANFPMILDSTGARLFAVYRKPAIRELRRGCHCRGAAARRNV